MSASTVVTSAEAPRHEGILPLSRDRFLGWLALLSVAALPLAEILRILIQRGHLIVYGDQALAQLGAQRAWRLDQLLGPYSRDGFHHPGPALFYFLAPFVRALEPSSTGLYLGSMVISGSALVAAVAVLWRRAGALVALWSAAVISLFCLCVRVGTLREPWNPYVVIAPMVLFVVLWALGTTGMRGASVWALVVGSFEVQTHIATAGFVVIMSAALLVWLAVRAWRRGDRRIALRRISHPGCVTGVVALVLIWVPSLIEAFKDHPNNVQEIWKFFTTSHQGPALRSVLKAAASAVTIIPFGNRDYVLTLTRTRPELAFGAVFILAAFLAAVWLSWRRRQPLAWAFVATSIAGVVFGVVSLSRTAGPVYFYFAVWMAFVPLSLLLAIGVALLAPATSERPRAHRTDEDRQGRPQWVLAGCVAAAVALGAATVQSDLRMGPVKTITDPYVSDTAAFSRAAVTVLRPTDRWAGITVATFSLWPMAAGMVVALNAHGVHTTVAPASSMALLFEPRQTSSRPVDVRYYLYLSTDSAGQEAARGRVLSVVNGQVLTFQRLAP